MKNNFFNSSVLLSVLPVFFFISGSLSLIKPSLSLYVLNTDHLIPLFLVLSLGSYLFLRDIISVLISFGCAVNTLFGILFFIDLFKVEYSSLTTAAIMISLGFSIFLNTLLLCSIHQNKKSTETTAKQAVKKTIEMYFWTVALSCAGIALLYFLAFFQYDSDQASNFITVTISGFIASVISGFILLPLLGNCLLCHINEERMQDDLKLSYSEQFLQYLNQNLERIAALMVWFISPFVNNKIIAFLITTAAAVLITTVSPSFFGYIFSIENYSSAVLSLILIYFLIVVIRYQSYFLALIPIFSMVINYFLLELICRNLLSDSPIILEITFCSSIGTAIIGNYFQIDSTLVYVRNNATLQDAILNATAKTLYFVFVSAVITVLFLVFSMYLIVGFNLNILLSGCIIIGSGIVLLFPVPAYLLLFCSLHQSVLKPRKRKIKSIYL